MSVIVRGSAVSGNGAGTSSGNFTISSPSATQTGDYLVIALTTNKDTVTPPSGWTQLQNGQSSSLPSQSFVYGRVSPGSGVQNFTWNLSNNTAAPNVAVCWAFGNVDTGHIVSAKNAEDTTSPTTTPTVTTTVKSLMLHIVCDRYGSTPSITWTYPGGFTKTEGTNDGSVGYTASGGTNGNTVNSGSQSGVNITGTANPSTSFAYQVGLGDALVQVNGADTTTNIIESAGVQATLVGADTGSGAESASLVIPVATNDPGSGAESATARVFADEPLSSTEAVKVVSGGSTLAFANDAVGLTDAASIRLTAGDTGGSADVRQTATIGIQGPLPLGPRIVFIVPPDE